MATSKRKRHVSAKKLWLFFLAILLVSLGVAIGFAPRKVKSGDTVRVNYTLTLDDGSVYYTTIGRKPFHVTLGQGTLPTGFEEALMGMRVGETRTVILPSEKAFGPYRPDLIDVIDRSQIPDGLQPTIGQQWEAELKDGSHAIVVITDMTDTSVTVDANHPLAGKSLTFAVDVVQIGNVSASTEFRRQMYSGSMLLVLGIFVSGFVFLSRRNLSIKGFLMKR